MPRSIRSSISKRIKFHDRPDLFNGKYFYITAPYGLFYLLGGIIGYNITYNLFCLLISCSIGILFIILSIAHAIDYYNKAPIASFYVSFPFGKKFNYILLFFQNFMYQDYDHPNHYHCRNHHHFHHHPRHFYR